MVQPERPRPALLCQGCRPAPAAATAERGPRGVADLVNVKLRRRAHRAAGQRGVQRHQACGGRVQRVAAPGGHPTRHVRVSLVEPGAVATELGLSATTGRRSSQALRERFGRMERLQAQDIADAITYIVTWPRHVAINEILIRPSEQDQ